MWSYRGDEAKALRDLKDLETNLLGHFDVRRIRGPEKR
jgi:hypothetical protein